MLCAEGCNAVQDNCEGKVEGLLKVVWQKADQVQVTVGLWDAVAVTAEELARDWHTRDYVLEDVIHKHSRLHANRPLHLNCAPERRDVLASSLTKLDLLYGLVGDSPSCRLLL